MSPDQKAIRVLLVDDHALVRSGLRALIEAFPGVKVVAEAADGNAALELVARERPDVVLMDVTMPELNGLEATTRVIRKFPEVRVLVLSMHAEEEYVGLALRAGAAGYLLKDASASELELAIRSVARGDTYLTPAATKGVVADYLQRGAEPPTPRERLTSRQREILQLIADGHTTKEIARRLGLSVKTVEAHRTQLMERLGIHDIAGLVRWAIRAGLVGPEA
jgi:DNA-binding NarL/FixJ family response regulator